MIWLYLLLAFFAGWIGRSMRQAQLQRRWTRRAIEKSTAEAQAKIRRLFEDGLRDVVARLTPRDPDVCTRCGKLITGAFIGDGDGTGQRFAHPSCYREGAPDPVVQLAHETLANEARRDPS